MKKSLNELMRSLIEGDYKTLQSIYNYRCLNEEQIYQLHFQQIAEIDESVSKEHAKSRIRVLSDIGLIKPVDYLGGERVYFLTPSGIEAIRQFFKFERSVYDARKRLVKRGYYRASELDIYPKAINHQVHLNQFVIEFQKVSEGINYRYFDEKHVSQYTNIRPDGLISLPDTNLFLEMDMATESKKQLCEKWQNYRNFLNSREYSYQEKRIVVLFIVDGTTKTKERIDLVKYTIYESLLDILDSEFEIYVGTKKELLLLMKNRLLPSCMGDDPYTVRIRKILETKHGFSVANGESIRDEEIRGKRYAMYMRKQNSQGKMLIEDGRVQEFVVDDYFFKPTTIVAKVAYLDSYNSLFKSRYNRDISYLVVGKSEDQLYNDLKLVDLIGLKNVYFSTYQRLKDKTFHEAVFQFDLMGNLHHFTNNGLEEREFEGNFEQQRLAT